MVRLYEIQTIISSTRKSNELLNIIITEGISFGEPIMLKIAPKKAINTKKTLITIAILLLFSIN